MEKRKYVPDEVRLSIVENQDVQYGPKVSELAYQEGGMSSLIGEAMLGKGGKTRLTPEDLMDINRIGLIHPILRDELARGNSIDIRSTGHQDIIHPKPVILYKNE